MERISDVVLLVAFLLGIYMGYDNIYVYYHARAERVIYQKKETIEEVKKDLSDEVVAWVTLDDTNIDYPIMQCDNNIKYLNTDAYGEYSLAGAIFLDFRCSPDFTDEYNLVYGHHMGAGMMFGALDEYIDQSYFDSHQTGALLVDKEEIPLDVVAFLQIDASDDEIFNPTEETDIYSFIQNHARYITKVDTSRKILALSTCKEPMSTERTVLICQYDIGSTSEDSKS